jgi:hypothetical protein
MSSCGFNEASMGTMSVGARAGDEALNIKLSQKNSAKMQPQFFHATALRVKGSTFTRRLQPYLAPRYG